MVLNMYAQYYRGGVTVRTATVVSWSEDSPNNVSVNNRSQGRLCNYII